MCALAQLRRQVGELEASKAVLERQLKERAGGWRNELEEATPSSALTAPPPYPQLLRAYRTVVGRAAAAAA